MEVVRNLGKYNTGHQTHDFNIYYCLGWDLFK